MSKEGNNGSRRTTAVTSKALLKEEGLATDTAQPQDVSCQAAKRDKAALKVLDTGTGLIPKISPCAFLWLPSTSCNWLQALENEIQFTCHKEELDGASPERGG